MQNFSPGKITVIFLTFILFGLVSNIPVHGADIKCPTNIKLIPGQTDTNEYAMNVENGCGELIIDVKSFSGSIQNLVFDAHDLAQNYTFDVTYKAVGDSVYKELYLDKDISTVSSNECNSFANVVQPKYSLNSCFKENVIGVDQKAESIKIVIGMLAGKDPNANEYAYFRNFRINSTSIPQQNPDGGINYRRIRYDNVCGNYKFWDLDAVFSGQVTSVTNLPDGDDDYLGLKTRYRFEVEKVLKGTVLENEKLVLLGSDTENIMVDEKYYIVYAEQLRDDKFQAVCVKQVYSPDDVPDYLQEPFDDIQDVQPFQPYIVGLYYNGIVNGYGDSGMYYPDQCVKRSHLAKFLVNTFGFGIDTNGVYLPDVKDSQSELDLSILTLYKLGIVQGYSNGYYNPDECVTREQAAAFIIRALQHAYPDLQFNGVHSFPDINNSSFSLYIAYLYNIQVDGTRVVNGNGMGYFDPQRPLTRGEMAKMMYLIWMFKNQYRDVKGICLRNGGSWIEGAKECEGLTSEMCLNSGGTSSCQSRERIRIYEEEEIDISVQSSCSSTEVAVCTYPQSVPPYTPVPVPIPTIAVPETRCIENGGTWIADSKQCNGLDQNKCLSLGGEFDRCGSSCGRYFSGQCNYMCVQACYFDEIPSNCTNWYDGCNTCTVSNGVIGGCTKMYCAQTATPRCLQYLPQIPLNCKGWYDGCNNCGVENGNVTNCTMMACEQYGTPRCTLY
ncbi:S-layer homology domain-containing protein [Candidatus Dojkabacteria bacterium]|nr:S-layer homology domain-containing protein [Candidatus Dojkabacteria bacterium]